MRALRECRTKVFVCLLIVSILVMGVGSTAASAASSGGPKKPVAKTIIVMISGREKKIKAG